jgi:hypothetical protein
MEHNVFIDIKMFKHKVFQDKSEINKPHGWKINIQNGLQWSSKKERNLKMCMVK